MKYKNIIWDWNGTLFDDIQISVEAVNEMLSIKGYGKTVSYDRYREIFCFPVIEYYKKVGFDFSRHSFDELAKLYVERYSEKQNSAALFDGAKSVLEEFKSNGINQTVISVCEKERLAYQVGLFGIEGYFSDVLGTDDNYAVSKVDIAKKYFSEVGINPREVLFVGDTCHDYETACAVGCSCVLVGAGHQNKNVLKKTGATVIDSLDCLKDYVI